MPVSRWHAHIGIHFFEIYCVARAIINSPAELWTVNAANSGIDCTMCRCFHLFRRMRDVTIVDDARHAGIDRHLAAQVAVVVYGLGLHGDRPHHVPGHHRQVGSSDLHRFPQMPMPIAHARHQNHVFCVDQVGVGRVDVVAHLDDLAAVDQDITAIDVAQLGVHAQDRRTLDKGSVPLCAGGRDGRSACC